MVLFCLASFVLFLSHRVSAGQSIPFPVTFGNPGDNVTIHSSSRLISRSFLSTSWYRLKSDGGMEHKVYLSTYSSQFGRYRGAMPQNSPNVTLTIYNVTEQDSGQYFPVVLDSFQSSPGTMAVLSISDPQKNPSLRVFVSQNPNKMLDVLCELRGQRPDWTGPEWEGVSGAEIKTGEAIDDSGVFTRISILSVALNTGPLTVTCVSKKNMSTIRRSITIQQKDDLLSWWLYLFPLCSVLILATIIIAVWACQIN